MVLFSYETMHAKVIVFFFNSFGSGISKQVGPKLKLGGQTYLTTANLVKNKIVFTAQEA